MRRFCLPTLGMVARGAASAWAPILSHTGVRSARRAPSSPSCASSLSWSRYGRPLNTARRSSRSSRSSPRSQASTASAERLPPATAWIDRLRAGDGVAGREHALFGRAAGVVVGDEPRVGQRQVVGAVAEPGRVAGRHDDGRRGELEARAADLLAAALLAHDADALDALRLAGLGLDLLGQGAELDLDALLEGGGEVARADGDVVGLVLRDDDDVLGALAARRAGDVEGGDAVADHDDLLRELDGPALAHALEQLEAVQGGVVAGDDVARLLPRCRR